MGINYALDHTLTISSKSIKRKQRYFTLIKNLISYLANCPRKIIFSLIGPEPVRDHTLKISAKSVRRKLRYQALLQMMKVVPGGAGW